MQPGQLPARPIAWTATQPAMRRALDSRALTRRYLQPGFGRLRCNRCECFVCFPYVVDALPEQCLRRRPSTFPFVAAVFRTKWLLPERCSATCLPRRRPGQMRRRQGRLQITAVLAPGRSHGRSSGRRSELVILCPPGQREEVVLWVVIPRGWRVCGTSGNGGRGRAARRWRRRARRAGCRRAGRRRVVRRSRGPPAR